MAQLIDKSALVAEIERRRKEVELNCGGYKSYDEHRCDDCTVEFYNEFLEIINTLEVKDPYEQCVQYDSIKTGIQAHAETYSFNIESELFNQLTKEQQALWRKEIEQAVISGGDAGVKLARDPRYKENLEVKEVDLDIKQRMEECPYRQTGCTMYNDYILECRGACSWVVDYPKLKELKAQEGK